MKYRVFFDSNQLFNENGPTSEPFNLAIPTLHNLLKEHGKTNIVSICLPEIVTKERIQGKLEQVETNIKDANKRIKILNDFGYEVEPIEPLGHKKHKAVLQKNADAFIKKYGVEKVENKNIDLDDLIERAVCKLKPFGEKGAGFKDTLIFLSMIHDAGDVEKETAYIFCTKDKHFNEEVVEEFKRLTKKTLHIVSTPEEVKEKLDELIPLGLHLEERNERVREFILSKTGTLTKRVNKLPFIPSHRRVTSGGWGGSVDHDILSQSLYNFSGSAQDEEDIVGYDYEDIDLIDFQDLGDFNYRVEVRLTTAIIYKDEDKSNGGSLYRGYSAPHEGVIGMNMENPTVVNWMDDSFSSRKSRYRSATKTFNLTVTCNTETGLLSIESVF